MESAAALEHGVDVPAWLHITSGGRLSMGQKGVPVWMAIMLDTSQPPVNTLATPLLNPGRLYDPENEKRWRTS